MKKRIIQSLKISTGILISVFTMHILFAFKPSPAKKHIHFDKILGADISFTLHSLSGLVVIAGVEGTVW